MLSMQQPESAGRRLLLYSLLVLSAFTALAFTLSFFASGPFQELARTSVWVRLCVLGLTLGFAALLWQRDEAVERESDRLTRQQLLASAFENRIRVIDSLLDSEGVLGGSLSFDDVLKVVLDSAVEIAGAEGGSIDFFEARADELAVSLHEERTNEADHDRTLHLDLRDGDRLIGLLNLNLRPRGRPDPTTMEALEHFTGEAARTLDKAKRKSIERASSAYLEAANLVKSRFLTTISHELRTPLTSIIGYAKTLSNHWARLEDDQKQEFVKQIDTQGNKLCRLVERILEAARVELQGVVLEPVVHDVRESVEAAIAPFLATDADRIHLALPAQMLEAEIDPFVIDQVISNLVDNSLRFTEGKVRVSLDAYRSSLTLSVTDEGEGIDSNQLNLVLEPLYRIDENVQSGTGLGLHIVRTLVESHGGRGEIRSGPNGTSIAIKLPRYTGGRLSIKVPATGYLRRAG